MHLSYNNLLLVIEKMAVALKANGIIYTSFKYGTFERERNGRYFIDITEETFSRLIHKVKELKVEKQWIT